MSGIRFDAPIIRGGDGRYEVHESRVTNTYVLSQLLSAWDIMLILGGIIVPIVWGVLFQVPGAVVVLYAVFLATIPFFVKKFVNESLGIELPEGVQSRLNFLLAIPVVFVAYALIAICRLLRLKGAAKRVHNWLYFERED